MTTTLHTNVFPLPDFSEFFQYEKVVINPTLVYTCHSATKVTVSQPGIGVRVKSEVSRRWLGGPKQDVCVDCITDFQMIQTGQLQQQPSTAAAAAAAAAAYCLRHLSCPLPLPPTSPPHPSSKQKLGFLPLSRPGPPRLPHPSATSLEDMATVLHKSHVIDWAVPDCERTWSGIKMKIKNPPEFRPGVYDSR